jgi:hypothetical protein
MAQKSIIMSLEMVCTGSGKERPPTVPRIFCNDLFSSSRAAAGTITNENQEVTIV